MAMFSIGHEKKAQSLLYSILLLPCVQELPDFSEKSLQKEHKDMTDEKAGPQVSIVSDSASSIPKELRRQYGISLVPIWVQIGSESLKEGVDLTVDEFYKRLDGPHMPSTSAPPPSDFVEVYRQLAKKVKDIISIHIASTASATFSVASLAAKSVPEANITVYDSGSVSMGVGFLVLEAARCALRGLKKDEILARLDSLKSRIFAFAAIPTLKYLRRSGRVSRGRAALASLLSIKPILEIKDGVIGVVDQVRTFPRALARVLDLAKGVAGKRPAVVAVIHANAPDAANEFADRVKKHLNVRELIVEEAGPTLAVHGGPGLIGIVLYTL
ncbi:MAG TPA: DegV family protein [Firmicutes bacterium]|nr:DegV family protein [Candidatus Fermentithermobacillaceae bacterium]